MFGAETKTTTTTTICGDDQCMSSTYLLNSVIAGRLRGAGGRGWRVTIIVPASGATLATPIPTSGVTTIIFVVRVLGLIVVLVALIASIGLPTSIVFAVVHSIHAGEKERKKHWMVMVGEQGAVFRLRQVSGLKKNIYIYAISLAQSRSPDQYGPMKSADFNSESG